VGKSTVKRTVRWTLRPVRPGERAAVRRLVQLYIYDLGGDRWGVEPDGTFAPADWHRRFWARRGAHHFVIRVDGRLAGFALVRERAGFAGAGVREIGEFFVLRKYRRLGVGTRAARELFERFPGRWEVAVLVWNVAALPFWRRVIAESAAGEVVERRRRHDDLSFFVLHFTTPARVSVRTAGRGAPGRSPTSRGRHPSGSRRRSSPRRPGT
jgi:predicted acetyltransferase